MKAVDNEAKRAIEAVGKSGLFHASTLRTLKFKNINHTAFVQFWPEGHREPRNEVGSLSPAERLVGFEPGTFRF